MGILDFLRKAPKQPTTTPAPTLNGWMPMYSQFGQNIFASDVVQQALKCIVDEVKKLKPTHVRYKDADPVPVKGRLQDVLAEPNALMTQSDFLEKVTPIRQLRGRQPAYATAPFHLSSLSALSAFRRTLVHNYRVAA